MSKQIDRQEDRSEPLESAEPWVGASVHVRSNEEAVYV